MVRSAKNRSTPSERHSPADEAARQKDEVERREREAEERKERTMRGRERKKERMKLVKRVWHDFLDPKKNTRVCHGKIKRAGIKQGIFTYLKFDILRYCMPGFCDHHVI